VCHSPSLDEVAHLPSGVSHWQFGRFDMYRVNPPLVRAVAALPVVLAEPATDWRRWTGVRPEWYVCHDFMEANGERCIWYFSLARWACIPLILAGGYACLRWASELYGSAAGLFALALWCFCPNVLGNGSMITPDAAAAALGVLAGYCFWRWLRQPTWARAAVAGVTLGLAELTKMTWVVLFIVWPLLWVVWLWRGRREVLLQLWFCQGVQLCGILLLALYLINLGYLFDGSFSKLGDFHFISEALGGTTEALPGEGAAAHSNRFANSWLGQVPVPVPRDYVLGMDIQKNDFEKGRPSYLRGEWRDRGWWYYYLYGLAIKVPLGTWVLMLLALVLKLSRWRLTVSWRDEVVVLVPLLVVLVLVSSQVGLNRHLRYVLPIFPFAFVWAGQVGQVLAGKGRKLPLLAAGALIWSVSSSLWIYPHSQSYFNELVGGPTGGHAHLIHSNIDWGQDLLFLKRWSDEHPEARPLWLAYSGNFDPGLLGLSGSRPPLEPVPGWFAMGVTCLRTQPEYGYFLRLRPLAMAGYSIYIYCVTLEEANQARQELGLCALPAP